MSPKLLVLLIQLEGDDMYVINGVLISVKQSPVLQM